MNSLRGFSRSLGIRMRAGALAIVYAFGEFDPQSGDLLSQGVVRQAKPRGEFLSVFDLFASAESVVIDDQFALFGMELIQTPFQAFVSGVGFDLLAGVDHQVIRRGLDALSQEALRLGVLRHSVL